MSGAPFNAMWTAPAPPSYTDTVGVDPTEYVVLTTSHGHEALVHKDCLIESPVLRFCFRKREPLTLPEVVVRFTAKDAAQAAAKSPSVASAHLRQSTSVTDSAAPAAGKEQSRVEGEEGEADGAVEGGTPASGEGQRASVAFTDDAPDEDAAAGRHPVTLTESLCTDNSVHITFPRLSAAELEVLVAYLYFKHRYNRRPADARPNFDIPAAAALEVMRVSKALDC